jgi:dTDP-4-dehydrorhamnose reductase
MIVHRVLITGANGMIGRAMSFGMKCSQQDFDICNDVQVTRALDHFAPDVIVHLAASDLRTCERDPVAALATNVKATHDLAVSARDRGIRLVFLSSSAVFSGPRGVAFNEDSEPAPVNVYGMSKYLGETAIQDIMTDYLIVRTGWVFGGHGAHHRKFVNIALEAALAGRPIWGNRDQDGSPVYVRDLVLALQSLIELEVKGIRHVVNAEPATGYDIAKEIVALTRSASVVSSDPEANPSKVIARSASEVLESRYGQLRPWREALRDYLHDTYRTGCGFYKIA